MGEGENLMVWKGPYEPSKIGELVFMDATVQNGTLNSQTEP